MTAGAHMSTGAPYLRSPLAHLPPPGRPLLLQLWLSGVLLGSGPLVPFSEQVGSLNWACFPKCDGKEFLRQDIVVSSQKDMGAAPLLSQPHGEDVLTPVNYSKKDLHGILRAATLPRAP